MSNKIKPCHCGYEGALMGTQHKEGYLSLICPECRRTVKAFTPQGLTDMWNAKPEVDHE